MKKIILTRGLPGSGKSTWAKNKVNDSNGTYKRINRDDLRVMLDPDGHGGYVFSKSNEKFVTVAQDALVLKALEAGKHVILDDTNFGDKVYNRIKELTKGMNVKIEINEDFLETPLEECIRRDTKRANGVGEAVIRRFYNKHLYVEPVYPEIVYDSNLPDAILVDLDGTMSLMNGKRSPYEWKKCINDDLNVPVSDIVDMERSNGTKIIFFSGRSDIAKPETLEWLTRYGHSFEILEMRKHADQRKDTIVKKEFYDRFILGQYNIKYCLDDRNIVVDMYRSIGLTCLAVAPGDF